MHPLNHVITNVHRIGISRHDFDAKRVSISGSFKCLVPPTRAFDQSRAHRFGRAAVDVVNDGLNRIARGRRWILFLQAMMIDITLDDWFADRRGEIHVLSSKVSGARIVEARFESRRRQFDERNMLANRDRLGHRRHRPD